MSSGTRADAGGTTRGGGRFEQSLPRGARGVQVSLPGDSAASGEKSGRAFINSTQATMGDRSRKRKRGRPFRTAYTSVDTNLPSTSYITSPPPESAQGQQFDALEARKEFLNNAFKDLGKAYYDAYIDKLDQEMRLVGGRRHSSLFQGIVREANDKRTRRVDHAAAQKKLKVKGIEHFYQGERYNCWGQFYMRRGQCRELLMREDAAALESLRKVKSKAELLKVGVLPVDATSFHPKTNKRDKVSSLTEEDIQNDLKTIVPAPPIPSAPKSRVREVEIGTPQPPPPNTLPASQVDIRRTYDEISSILKQTHPLAGVTPNTAPASKSSPREKVPIFFPPTPKLDTESEAGQMNGPSIWPASKPPDMPPNVPHAMKPSHFYPKPLPTLAPRISPPEMYNAKAVALQGDESRRRYSESVAHSLPLPSNSPPTSHLSPFGPFHAPGIPRFAFPGLREATAASSGGFSTSYVPKHLQGRTLGVGKPGASLDSSQASRQSHSHGSSSVQDARADLPVLAPHLAPHSLPSSGVLSATPTRSDGRHDGAPSTESHRRVSETLPGSHELFHIDASRISSGTPARRASTPLPSIMDPPFPSAVARPDFSGSVVPSRPPPPRFRLGSLPTGSDSKPQDVYRAGGPPAEASSPGVVTVDRSAKPPGSSSRSSMPNPLLVRHRPRRGVLIDDGERSAPSRSSGEYVQGSRPPPSPCYHARLSRFATRGPHSRAKSAGTEAGDGPARIPIYRFRVPLVEDANKDGKRKSR